MEDLSKYKILYSPKEGTSGFWGLRDVPEESEYCTGFDDRYCELCQREAALSCSYKKQQYNAALEYCKSNSLEIVNPDVLSGLKPFVHLGESGKWFIMKNVKCEILQPGDIFDLPEGFEFKEYFKHDQECEIECLDIDSEKVLRLVKTETFKERFKKLFPQPKPEESQYWLWDEVDNIFQANKSDEAMRICERKFTIQRKKQ